MNSEQFIQSLDEQLRAAANRKFNEPRRSRSRHIIQVAAAAAIVVVGAGLLSIGSSRDVSADVEIIRSGDELIIRLNDVETRASDIEQAALDAGLDVRVSEVPVGPSNVGRFAGASSSERLDDVHIVDGDRSSGFDGFRVPLEFDGYVELLLGRPAKPGERWRVSSWSTARGEPLECERVTGRSVGEVLDLVASRGIESVSVSVIDDPLGPRRHDRELERFSTATVFRVTNSDPDHLSIEAAWEPSKVPESSSRHTTGCRGSDGP